MRRKALVWMAVAMMVLALPSSMDAQVATWQDVQVADIETMGDKFTQLAEVFDESHYDWRPMEDVRSVGEVLGLAIAEANLFPTAWGLEPGRGPRPGSDQSWSARLRSASPTG